MTDPNHESDEALLKALGGRARERLERGTASLQDTPTPDPDAFSEENLASVTQAVLKRTAGAANERPRSVALLVVAAATIAAALLLWFAIDRAPDPAPLVVRYQGTFVGGLKATRAASATTTDIARLRPNSPFTWTLVPETAIDEAVDVRLEAVSQGETRCLKVPTEELTAHPRGGLEIESTARNVFDLPPGPWTIRAVVGPIPAFDPDTPCAIGPGLVLAAEQKIVLLE